jgi:hypothetical protein
VLMDVVGALVVSSVVGRVAQKGRRCSSDEEEVPSPVAEPTVANMDMDNMA